MLPVPLSCVRRSRVQVRESSLNLLVADQAHVLCKVLLKLHEEPHAHSAQQTPLLLGPSAPAQHPAITRSHQNRCSAVHLLPPCCCSRKTTSQSCTWHSHRSSGSRTSHQVPLAPSIPARWGGTWPSRRNSCSRVERQSSSSPSLPEVGLGRCFGPLQGLLLPAADLRPGHQAPPLLLQLLKPARNKHCMSTMRQ